MIHQEVDLLKDCWCCMCRLPIFRGQFCTAHTQHALYRTKSEKGKQFKRFCADSCASMNKSTPGTHSSYDHVHNCAAVSGQPNSFTGNPECLLSKSKMSGKSIHSDKARQIVFRRQHTGQCLVPVNGKIWGKSSTTPQVAFRMKSLQSPTSAAQDTWPVRGGSF